MPASKIVSKTATDDAEIAVDGFTWAEVEAFILDTVVPARCVACCAEVHVQADAEDLGCEKCGAMGAVTSPLRKLGLF